MNQLVQKQISRNFFSTGFKNFHTSQICQQIIEFLNQQDIEIEIHDNLKVAEFGELVRRRGHLAASLDPIGRTRGPPSCDPANPNRWQNKKLVSFLENYPLHADTFHKCQYIAQALDFKGSVHPNKKYTVGKMRSSLWELVEELCEAYCGPLVAQVDCVRDEAQREWMMDRMEQKNQLTDSQKRSIMQKLVAAEEFEKFLGRCFPSSKRFGIEGLESAVVGVEALLARSCVEHGCERIEMGMAHRGRLSILCNVLHKSVGMLFGEMEGKQSDFHVGDVKYHLGLSSKLHLQHGKELIVSIAPNPSHLEAIYPVIMGMVRAEQTLLQDVNRKKVMGLILHGDSSFCGLGVVTETLQLSELEGYTVGGTVHIILNNQVGFTTSPYQARSSPHSSDIAAMLGVPVIHANADCPESVIKACITAVDFRNQFGRDCVVDVVGYRRFGHNEQDDPVPTHPLLYAALQSHPGIVKVYQQKLESQNIVSAEQIQAWRDSFREELQKELEASTSGFYKETASKFLSSSWQGEALAAINKYSPPGQDRSQEPTGLPLATLQWVGNSICTSPNAFSMSPTIAELYNKRRGMVKSADSRVDWAMAEALAFGTLVLHQGVKPPGIQDENYFDESMGLNRGHYSVRLSGQDSERGTFNQRHAALLDSVSGVRYIGLNNIVAGRQDSFEVINSPLSEEGVLAFEYGYSVGSKGRTLTIWEAQFGDFANNAQCIIDEFISSAEEKWNQQSGLVLLLPHGYDGQGPDHTSGRMERFLQLCSDDPDHLPGARPSDRQLIEKTYKELCSEYGGVMTQSSVQNIMREAMKVNGKHLYGGLDEAISALWEQMGLPENQPVTLEAWAEFMQSYIRRRSERNTNMFVVNLSTPAQYFHVLRRQMNLPFSKPLVIFSPKYLLHHRPCTSALSDFSTGTYFCRVIKDGKHSDNTEHLMVCEETGKSLYVAKNKVRRVIVCTGQIYYKLFQHRRSKAMYDIALVRLEQIAPFPYDRIIQAIEQFVNAEVFWCQEEPKNMGAWSYVKPRLDTAIKHISQTRQIQLGELQYVGRPPAASPATASMKIHLLETSMLLEQAISD